MEDRLIGIEEQLSHLERHIETLDEVLRDAFSRIDRLERSLEQLQNKTQMQLDGIVEAMGDDEDEGGSAPGGV